MTPDFHAQRQPLTPGVTPIRARDVVGALRRAVELHLGGDFPAAEKRLRAVLAQAPALPQAHHHLAVVLRATGRTPEAIRHLRIALDHDPHLVGAKERLEQWLASRDDLTG